MGSQTTHGFPYPVGTDRVMDGDNAMQALAQYTDDYFLGSSGILTDTGWIPLTITTPANWAAVSGYDLRYRVIGKRVQTEGMATWKAGVFASNICTMPAAHRPTGNSVWLGATVGTGSKVVSQVFIDAAGNIMVPGAAYSNGTPTVNDSITIHGTYLLG
jgi:hypothetical protein